MTCKICEIANKKIIDAIELKLAQSKGSLSTSDMTELIATFPEHKNRIEKIDTQACTIHFNFHQRISRVPYETVAAEDPASVDQCSIETEKKNRSLTDDIGKDEAEVLYELLNSQAATFNALTNHVNKILLAKEIDTNTMLMHPETLKFYDTLATSMRSTVREIKELNHSLNGEKDSTSDSIVALVKAIRGPSEEEKQKEADMTTKEFDT